jgi:hypothetical protein
LRFRLFNFTSLAHRRSLVLQVQFRMLKSPRQLGCTAGYRKLGDKYGLPDQG